MRLLAYPFVFLAFVVLGLALALVCAALLTAAAVWLVGRAAFLHFFWPQPRQSMPLLRSESFFVDNAGQLIHRRWLNRTDAAPLERPVAHFSSNGTLLVYQ